MRNCGYVSEEEIIAKKDAVKSKKVNLLVIDELETDDNFGYNINDIDTDTLILHTENM